MVPLADAFNHKSVVVELPEGAVIEELVAEGTAEESQGVKGEAGASLSIAICNREATDSLEIILVNNPVSAGQEIFNTYGELSNGENVLAVWF